LKSTLTLDYLQKNLIKIDQNLILTVCLLCHCKIDVYVGDSGLIFSYLLSLPQNFEMAVTGKYLNTIKILISVFKVAFKY